MYNWLIKEQRKLQENYEIEEFVARRWKNPYPIKRQYTLFTQFLCLAAFDEDQSTIFYLTINEAPTEQLISEALLHFKDVKMLYHKDKPFKIMLQNVRATSVKYFLKHKLNPIVEQLMGRKAREIDNEWYPVRGEFCVKKELLEPYEDKNFDEVIAKLRYYKLTSFITNFLLNDDFRNSEALRYLAHATNDLRLTVNENNHITLINFE